MLTDPPPCPHCGRCVFAGPTCCDGMAADVRAYEQSPEYQQMMREQRLEAREKKRCNRDAKRLRRLARLSFRSWDTYDQFLADQSAWEGFAHKGE